jgi:hypothetical protein
MIYVNKEVSVFYLFQVCRLLGLCKLHQNRKGHEGLDRECGRSSTLSLTSSLDAGNCLTPCLCRLISGKRTGIDHRTVQPVAGRTLYREVISVTQNLNFICICELPYALYTSKRLVAPWGWPRFKAETCRSEYNKQNFAMNLLINHLYMPHEFCKSFHILRVLFQVTILTPYGKRCVCVLRSF